MFTSKDYELEDMVQFLVKVADLALEIYLMRDLYEKMWPLMLESLPIVANTEVHIEVILEQELVVRVYADLAPEIPMFRLIPAAQPSSSPSYQTI